MRKKMKKFLSLGILGLMMLSMMSISALAEDSNDGESAITVTGTLTQDAVWEDGTVVGPVTISGGTKEDPITITVNGTVTVDGQITLDQTEDCHVEFVGDGTLIRGANNDDGAMIWSQGGSRVWHTVKIDGLTLDGGAVWTGDVHGTLARGTTNSGVKATGGNASILFVRYSDVTLKKVTLQNQDNSNMKGCAVNLGYGNLYLEESVVQNNYHAGDRGGAIYMRNAGAVYAKKSFFYGNHGQGAVAGVSGSSAYACIMEFEDCIFSDNYSGSSGALFVVQNYLFPPANSVNYRFRGHLKIDNCVITDNACATKNHGLIYSHCYETPVYITDSTITGNDCNLFGYSSGPNKNLYLSGNTISNIYTGSLSAVPF